MNKRLAILMTVALGLTSACSGGQERDITLKNIVSVQPGPDEFAVLPGKPLQQPENFTDLPTPTPGAANLTDQNPLADGVRAFGGNPARLENSGVPASDGALVRAASRNGVDPNVRAELAAQDEEFRRRKSRFTKLRIAKQDLYDDVYKRETLDPHRELNRYRAAGARTPTAPPRGVK